MAVRRYVGEDANGLNHTLREGDAIDRDYMSPEANVLRSALDEMPRVDTAENPEVFRDIAASHKDLDGLLERYKPGAVVEGRAFTSASQDIPPEYFGAREDKPVRVRFVIDEPQNARDISATNPEEGEVIWQDGNRFGVRNVEAVGKDDWLVRMTDQGRN